MRYKNRYAKLISYSLCLIAISGFAQQARPNVHSAEDNYTAIAFYNDGHYQKAIDACNALIKANKYDTVAYTYRALSKEQLKDYAGARKDYNKLSKWTPKDARIHFKLGVLWSETDDYYHSIKEYTKALALDPTYAVAYNNRGNSEYMVGDGRSAMLDFTAAYNADTTYPDPLYNRGHLKIVYSNDYNGAIKDFSKAIEIAPNDIDAWFSRAQAYDEKNDTLNAVNDYDNVIQIDSTYMDAYYFRGCDRLKLSDYEGAVEDFSISLSSDSSYYLVYNLRGTALDSLGAYEQAIDDFTKSIKMHEPGVYNQVIESFNQAATMQENYGTAYLGRGYAYLKSGSKENACEDFNMAYYYGLRGETKILLDENCKAHVKIYWK